LSGRYEITTDGTIYEIEPYSEGKGKDKRSGYQMRCVHSLTKSPDNVFLVSPEQIEKGIKFGLIKKL
jgi:hypothetical protein